MQIKLRYIVLEMINEDLKKNQYILNYNYLIQQNLVVKYY